MNTDSLKPNDTPPATPENPTSFDSSDSRVESVISVVLWTGVLTSMALILIGAGVALVRTPAYLRDASISQGLTAAGTEFPHTLSGVAKEIAQGRGRAIVALGLLLLIATPVARVVVSVVAFAHRKDWTFTLITLGVLIILLVSFLLGKLE
jgi:uncharacterized membrane protein